MIGSTLAHYEITTHLGSGGMGDVYQATDTKLGRSVATKFLPEAFSHDTERVARFQREAQVLASLNHSITSLSGLAIHVGSYTDNGLVAVTSRVAIQGPLHHIRQPRLRHLISTMPSFASSFA